jgi:hypothetical protein
MQHFYDGQIRRYITQLVRMMSNFSYKDAQGNLVTIPVMYGDLTRQVASIIRDNSENKIPSAPRMALYVTNLEMDRTRTGDKTYSNKVNIRERAFDENNQEYLNYQGKNYTVERLMPAPYNLTVNVDLWTTNTDMKLQIMEQILVLFNPSLEIQTTDNYIDWASLSVVDLEGITFSSRSIPMGVDSEIDVATLTFKTPIYISAPVKVKRLGVITNIITSIFDETKGTVDLGLSSPILNAYDDGIVTGAVDTPGSRLPATDSAGVGKVVTTNYQGYGVYVTGNSIQLIDKNVVGQINWQGLLEAHPGLYEADISRIYIRKLDTDLQITGTFSINELDNTKIVVNWDADSFANDDVIVGRTSIDYIIDPTTVNPADLKTSGLRVLLLDSIGSTENADGPDAWKNNSGTDFYAGTNDIIEWDGSSWSVVFDASATTDITHTTNLNTGVQYRWNGSEWLLSVDGDYPQGAWRLKLEG